MIEIDEIISNAEYCADVYERMNKAIHPALQVSDYKRYAEDHGQLAGWLKDYKRLKERESCDDCISRQVAIDAFEKFIHELGIEDEPYNYGEMALSAKNVPPVTPQPKIGRWIWVTEDIYKCSECYEDIHVREVMNVPQYGWCPLCGTKMEESEAEE